MVLRLVLATAALWVGCVPVIGQRRAHVVSEYDCPPGREERPCTIYEKAPCYCPGKGPHSVKYYLETKYGYVENVPGKSRFVAIRVPLRETVAICASGTRRPLSEATLHVQRVVPRPHSRVYGRCARLSESERDTCFV
jgi:hypothetical protein